MNFPEDLVYTPSHEWVRVKGNEALVGITDFAQGELGDVVYVDIGTVGQTIGKDGVFGTIEAVKTVSDLFMPVSGKVLEKNPKIDSNPELINKDPYGEGWIVKLELSVPDQISHLLSAEAYRNTIGH